MRLLIATGGAPHSGAALRLGALIASTVGVTPTILMVIRRKEGRGRAESVLAQAREIVLEHIPEVHTVIRLGNPAKQIVAEAFEGRYDIVIVGERREHHLVRRFLGSTTRRVVERSSCPVIIAKGWIRPIHRILLCDSGAESLSLLDRFTARLANLVKESAAITVLHVMSQMSAGPGVPGKQLRASTQELIQEHTPEGELLAQDVRILERLNLHPDTKVRHGRVVDEILNEARSGDYDLIVIGAHHDEGWQGFLLEDLAFQIMMQADRPVLILR